MSSLAVGPVAAIKIHRHTGIVHLIAPDRPEFDELGCNQLILLWRRDRDSNPG
jgi:hypothetical protein